MYVVSHTRDDFRERLKAMVCYLNPRRGFTLIELVMVILLLSILAAIAIPNFIDFRTDAKNAATQGAIGAFRSAISIATASIQLKEDPTIPTPKYPTLDEMQKNSFTSSHPVLSGTWIMDPAIGIPKNPWSLSTLNTTNMSSILNCGGSKPNVGSTSGLDYRGWCYKETSGEIWANSNLNQQSVNKTENYY